MRYHLFHFTAFFTMKYKSALLIDDDADSNFVNSWIVRKEFAEGGCC
jgi:hypothetical protein